jgi:hypothetical protein
MITPMQRSPRIARAILASFVVAAAVAGTAYGVTRSATTVKSATIPPPPPLDAVAASVTALGGEPAGLPTLAPYKAHKPKHFVQPVARVVVLPSKNIVVLRKKAGASKSAVTHPASGGSTAATETETEHAEPNDSAETRDGKASRKHKHKHHSDDGGQGDDH